MDNIVIIGGGIAGPMLALALSKHGIKSTIYEAHAAPSTLGGAIHLPPSCLRAFDHLGLLERLRPLGAKIEAMEIWSSPGGTRLGAFPFGAGTETGGLRIRRDEIHRVLLEAIGKAGVDVHYSKRVVQIAEDGNEVIVTFADGSAARGGLLVGADGVHSAVRRSWVDPDRKAEYTGVAAAYGYVTVDKLEGKKAHFDPKGGAAMNVSRSGSLLTTFCDADKEDIYVAAVMSFPDLEAVRRGVDGWKVKGQEEEGVRSEVARRFRDSNVQSIREIVNGVGEWFLFPVFSLAMGGRWWKGRAICVGDAAHAMPPQGQSVGIAVDDIIILSRLLDKHRPTTTTDIATVFSRYDAIRRARVTKAHKQAIQRWENVKDISWLTFKIREWFVWLALILFASFFDEGMGYDVTKEEI